MRIVQHLAMYPADFSLVAGRRARGPILLAVLFLCMLAAPLAIGTQSYALHILMTVCLFAVFGHAWNLMAGYAGLLSFGQQVFIGIGGFAEALLYYYTPLSIWIVWPLSGLAALAFAWLLCLPVRARAGRRQTWIGVGIAAVVAISYEMVVFLYPSADVFGSDYTRRVILLLLIFLGALPLLRLRGAYFAIATWLIAECLSTVFSGWNLAGAGGGMQIKTDVTQLQLYYAALALVAVVTALIWIWIGSTQGLALTAVRDDEEAAQSCGVDVGRTKTAVFLLSATITGLAAGLYFIDVVIITPSSAFSISWASYIVFVVVSGGMGTVLGPIVGAVLFVVIERLLGAFAGQGLLVLGFVSIAMMLFMPRGMMGLIADIARLREIGMQPQAHDEMPATVESQS